MKWVFLLDKLLAHHCLEFPSLFSRTVPDDASDHSLFIDTIAKTELSLLKILTTLIN